ncbi:MAG: HD domain-containing protein [Lachnospiraceae bacterium]|nr:HD domain-containing protein [Lachnospiraceae bacterium]
MKQRRDALRTRRQAERWKRKFERHRELHRQIRAAAGDILESNNFMSTKGHIQHGDMTVNQHCVNVAKLSIAISEKLHIRCQREEMIRGALLHDYFLYDWHVGDAKKPHNLHGFYHPGIALNNASRDYDLTPRERDIIEKHMWPLTLTKIPRCREAWIVTTADKWCSLLETIHYVHGHGKVEGVEADRKTEFMEAKKASTAKKTRAAK